MNALRDKYAIVGTGKSRLGQVGLNSLALLEEAIKNALDDAGLTNKDVDGVVVRGPDDVYSHHQLVAARLGINVNFSTSLDNGGASQILAIILAVMAIEAGLGDHRRLRLRARQLVAHALRRGAACTERSHSGRSAAAGAWPGVRPFRGGVAACLRCPTPHVRIRHDAKRFRRDRNGVSRTCAAQSRRDDEETADH